MDRMTGRIDENWRIRILPGTALAKQREEEQEYHDDVISAWRSVALCAGITIIGLVVTHIFWGL